MGDRQEPQSVLEIGFLDGIPKLLACVIFSIVICFYPTSPHASDQTTNILILKSGTASFYDNVVDHIKKHFDHLCASEGKFCNKLNIQSYISNEAKPIYQEYGLVITLGLKARDYALRHLNRSTIINAMVPNHAGIDSDITRSPKTYRTIILEQPIERSFHLIKKILQPARRIGILIRPSEHRHINNLAKKAKKVGLSIHTEVIENEDEIGRKLSMLLDRVDVLLAQPDNKLYNRKTVSKILLSSYRKNIPVIGYSSAYVKAGALAAVYSSPEDIGKDIGVTIADYLAHRKIPTGSIFPSFFSVSINEKVGASLGIQLKSEPDDIVKYIQENEQ
ncbi:MAG: ABC transporter substrate binding protein [Pseudomonadota bacterium]